MPSDSNRPAGGGRSSVPELLSSALSQVSTLVRKEVQLARAEMGEKFGQAAGAIAPIAAGGAVLLGALILLLFALASLLVRLFDLATGWHQYRSDPAVSTTVWYRSGSPRGAPWTNQWGWTDEALDRIIDDAATEVDPAKRKALYADFVRRAQEELAPWMPIEQIFVSVFNRRVRNAGNNPRWASSSRHDTWLAPA